MTDLEKAIELSNKFKCITIGERCKNIEDACYKMEKWKDEQFSIERKQLIEKANQAVTQSFENGAIFKKKEMIEKACEWLKDMACYYAHWECNGDTYEDEIVYDTEKLIEDFKKAMEES